MTEEKEVVEYRGKINPDFISKAQRMYQKYKSDKAELNKRIVDNKRNRAGNSIYIQRD